MSEKIKEKVWDEADKRLEEISTVYIGNLDSEGKNIFVNFLYEEMRKLRRRDKDY